VSSTKIRIISAAVVVAFTLALYFWLDRMGLAILAFIATLGAQYEFIKLCLRNKHPILHIMFFTFCFLIFIFFALGFPSTSLGIIALGVMIMSAAVMLQERKLDSNEDKQNFVSTCALGFIYVGILPGITTQLVISHEFGLKIFLLCIITVITTDVMAYFWGRKFGKTKLLPSISPNKTKAGAYAGSIFATIAAFITAMLLDLEGHVLGLTLTGLLASMFAQFGDLFESILKRNAGQKDSGHIMPGHGGYLDRLDSILFSFPLFYCYVNWFM
jgi:phosphatidate cytidylyltransferase